MPHIFTNAKYADMLYIYGFCDGSATADIDGGNFRLCIVLGKLYQLCQLNSKYRYQKQYVISPYQQFCNCTVKYLNLGNRSEQDTYVYIFLLRMTNSMTSQNIDISSWDILYII